mmetsp:Transcript_20740/g.31958  ORF Transcript_20740/g.31958 Transcript_20740/m.31958 type:complete len:252 (+) Transcript_20740:2008-2763(+)
MSACSGASLSYHFFQSAPFLTSFSMKPSQLVPSCSSFWMSFQPLSLIHGKGFLASMASREVLPLRKKSSSILLRESSPSMIMVTIWKLYISLCLSKMPMQVKSYTSWVSLSLMFLSRFCRMLSFREVDRAFIKTVRYEDSEYSYISEIEDRPAIEKNRIDPLQATSLYCSLFSSMSALVALATSRACEISTDFCLAVFRVSMRGTLSTRGISVSLDNSSRRVSSRPLSVALFWEVSMMRFFLASSSSGRSY